MEPTKRDITQYKAFAVMAMLCLHLFDRMDYQGLYEPIIYLWNIPLSFYFAQLSDFCVMGFAFCSGYAHYSSYRNKHVKKYYARRMSALLSLYCNYWIVLFLFTGISILIGQGASMPGSWQEFLLNFTSVNTTYNGAQWYLLTFALITIASPVIFWLVDHVRPVFIMIGALILYVIGYYIRFPLDAESLLLLQVGRFGMTLFEYLIGVYFCKYHVFTILGEKHKQMFADGRNILAIIVSVLLFVAMLLGHTLIIGNVIIAPFTGLLLIILFQNWQKPHLVATFLDVVGRNTTNIWLVHMFFYARLFKNLVYVVRYPILIFVLMLVITIAVSEMINLIYRPIDRAIRTGLQKA